MAMVDAITGSGFPASGDEEQLFLQRTLQRRFARLEVPARPAVAFAAAGGLWGLGASLMSQRGFGDGAVAAASVGAAALAAAAVWAARAELLRSRSDGEDALRGCYREGGRLLPILAPDETLLATSPARGADIRFLRKAAAAAQALIGFLLAGLPLATLAGAGPSGVGVALGTWAAVFSLLGALLFGRGVHLLLAAAPVSWFALTDRRLVAMGRPGAARSLPLDALRNKPVVVERADGRATVAFAFSRLPSTGVLPFMGLWGLDDVELAEARRWAQLAVDARRGGIRALRGARVPR